MQFRLCLAIGVEHPNRLTLSREELDDWYAVWNLEPWGDARDDYRALAYQSRWSYMLNGSEGSQEPPKGVWPYFETTEDMPIEEMLASAKAFDSRLTPKEGGGYDFKPLAGNQSNQTIAPRDEPSGLDSNQ